MTAFIFSFSHVLSIAILQSLLLGAGIYGILLILLKLFRRSASVYKYHLAKLALLACFIMFLLPFYSFFTPEKPVVTTQGTTLIKPANDLPDTAIAHSFIDKEAGNISGICAAYSNIILMLYAVGVIWFAIKLLVAFTQTRKLRKHLITTDMHWRLYLERAAAKIGLRSHVLISFSDRIASPCIIGYAKAVILVPVSLATSLTPEQAEAVVLHELAHLKYFDYYINMAIQAVRCLLFFNPFTWLIIRKCNLYRELACDELAAKYGSSLPLAESLVIIARHQHNAPALAMGLSHNRHSLLFRIQNLLNMNYQTTAASSKSSLGITTLLLTFGLVLFTCSRSLSQNKSALHDQLTAIAQQMYDDGNRNFILIEAMNDGILQERQPYNFTYVAGKILVNGKELPAAFKEKYETRFKNFLLAHQNNGGGFYSLRSDGLKMEDIMNEHSSIRKNPAPAESLARIDGRTFSDHVVHAMYEDGLLDTMKYFIEYKKTGVFVNHKKLEGAPGEKYWKMFAEGEGYIPKTDKDITTIQNDPDMTPHIYIDAKGNQRMEYDKKTEAQKKAETARKAKQAGSESKNEPPKQSR